MRPISVVVLCGISAAVGAGIDHYVAGLDWSKLPLFARSDAPEIKPNTANHSGGGGVEVLGDRVRCDVRYQELKLPESEYRSFFDQCMGSTSSTKKSE
jgi:hypothetical protein